jgi:hypothetical protein
MGAQFGAVLIVTFLATPALAAGVLPFSGAFGNAGGCHFFNTGDVPGDDFAVLTPDTFSSYGTGCDFDALLSLDKGVATVSAICQSEGEAGAEKSTVEIIDHGTDGYSIRFDAEDEFGPYLACPPGDLALPSGTVQL